MAAAMGSIRFMEIFLEDRHIETKPQLAELIRLTYGTRARLKMQQLNYL